jgi:hypothetical protein
MVSSNCRLPQSGLMIFFVYLHPFKSHLGLEVCGKESPILGANSVGN